MINLHNTQFVILSCDSNLHSRVKAIKKTWAKNVNKVFLVDSNFLDFPETVGYNTPKNYEGIQEKYVQFFLNYEFTEFEYYFFTDDDTFVILKNLQNQNLPSPESKFCFGRHLHLSPQGIDKWGNNTYYPLSKITGKNSDLPLDYASGGSGFILSKTSCESIKGYLLNTPDLEIQRSAHGDVSIGFWMRSASIELIPSSTLWWSTPEILVQNSWEIYPNDGSELTFHYVSPERMLELHLQYNLKD